MPTTLMTPEIPLTTVHFPPLYVTVNSPLENVLTIAPTVPEKSRKKIALLFAPLK